MRTCQLYSVCACLFVNTLSTCLSTPSRRPYVLHNITRVATSTVFHHPPVSKEGVSRSHMHAPSPSRHERAPWQHATTTNTTKARAQATTTTKGHDVITTCAGRSVSSRVGWQQQDESSPTEQFSGRSNHHRLARPLFCEMGQASCTQANTRHCCSPVTQRCPDKPKHALHCHAYM